VARDADELDLATAGAEAVEPHDGTATMRAIFAAAERRLLQKPSSVIE
jgi:hypothetical protein